MKKVLILLTMLILALSSVIAWSYTPSTVVATPQLVSVSVGLVAKDPATWNPVSGGSGTIYGENIPGTPGYYAILIFKLEKSTNYTLIYYGDNTHNDVWPYATCLKSFTSSSYGYIIDKVKLDLAKYKVDPAANKIWLIRSSDVDCTAGQMISWNPTNYLFERKTI
ncbi:MAG: hypothetical protein ABIJ34_02605 [archaeon]